MSQENVEIAWRVCDAAWRRPKPDCATIDSLADPDHEMSTLQSLVEGGSYRGAEGFREWLASFEETFGNDWGCHVEEARAVDDERVIVTGWMRVRTGTASWPPRSLCFCSPPIYPRPRY